MDIFLRILQGMGFCWCWRQPKTKDHLNMVEVLERRLPIFWIMGPSGCGKTSIANRLRDASGYILVKISELLQKELAAGSLRSGFIQHFTERGEPTPDEVVINLIKEFIFLNYPRAKGFIFCGFPIHLKQAKLFELSICKVNIIVYCTVDKTTLISRVYAKDKNVDKRMAKRRFDDQHMAFQATYKHYENKTIKVNTSLPVEQTVKLLINDLDCFWGYSFFGGPSGDWVEGVKRKTCRS